MRDPLNDFPKPPFDVVDGKPDPAPDTGEQSYTGHGRLQGRRTLIIGGNTGIGRSVAVAYGKEGSDVALTYHSDPEAADEVVAFLQEQGRTATAIELDASEEQQCVSAVEKALEALGGIDTLVFVAGYQSNLDDIAELETEQLVKTFATNVYSIVWTLKAALPHLPRGASVITTSSIQASSPSADKVDYAATKAAILNMTKSLSVQLAPRGIRVNGVAPGPFVTELQIVSGSGVEDLGEDAPLERPGQPVETAGAYVYLASDDATYTTGTTILVAGGLYD